jgi:CheY-like chemotaxis protein
VAWPREQFSQPRACRDDGLKRTMTGEAGLRVLLVEDEVLNRKLVTAIFARASDTRLRTAELIEADTLAAAREVLAERAVDLVLLDVQLPDGNGLLLATELTELTELPFGQPRPVVIVLTAGALAEQRDAALAAGCDAMLIKPYTIAELEATVADCLPP